MLVSFSGIDGCGKTTLAKKAVEMLKAQGVNASYSRVADIALARRAGNALGKVSKEKSKAFAYSGGRVVGFLRKLSILLDVLLFRIKYGIAKLSKKSIVCDRYFYDSLVHLNFLGIGTPGFQKLLLTLAPKPDVAFLVIVQAEVAMNRNKEFPIEFYGKKHALYMKLFSNLKAVKINNTNLTSSLGKVSQAILEGGE